MRAKFAQRGEAELYYRTSLLMRRYHTCNVQYIIYDHPELKKKVHLTFPDILSMKINKNCLHREFI
jgi:hypothetical protein